jgi:transposase, IS30 family
VDPVSIHDRPEDIEGRLVPGHYEGDLIVGPAGSTAALGTLVERTSSHLTLFHLPDNHGAEATLAALTAAVRRPQWPVLSLTWDRGSEMAGHRSFTNTTASRSTSPTRTPRGSAAATKTPTACSASSFPKAPT